MVHTQCEEFNALTAKGSLTGNERKYFLSKLCKVANHEYHVCCGRERQVVKLPEAPTCGFYLSDKVSILRL